jgi:hypothetical protein
MLLHLHPQERIDVFFEAPYYGMKTGKWMNSSEPPIVQKDIAGLADHSSNATAGGRKARRLLQLQPAGLHQTASTSHQPQVQQQSDGAALAVARSMRLLQQQQNATIQQPKNNTNSISQSSSSQTLQGLGFPGFSRLTPVWVVYTQLDPLNVTALLTSLSQACGGVQWRGGVDVAEQQCGAATRKALRSAGMKVDDAKYQQMIIGKPVVSGLLHGCADSNQQQSEV